MSHKHPHRRRSAEKPREPRYWNAYPYDDGETIEVELRGSRNGLRAHQLGTLDSLRLRKRGDVKPVRFNRYTTPGMLHAVRHIIVDRPIVVERPIPREPTANGASNVIVDPEHSDVTLDTYTTASGRGSVLLKIRGDGLLRVEAQKGAFALMWPTRLRLPTFVKRVHSLWWSDDGTATIVAGEAQELTEVDIAKLEELLTEHGQAMRFLRLDFADRSFTWAARYEDLERAGYEPDADTDLAGAHEVSFAGDEFEPLFARALLEKTATFKPKRVVEELVHEAERSLRDYIPDVGRATQGK